MKRTNTSKGNEEQKEVAQSHAEKVVHDALHRLKEWIPSQGPIGVFVHHNTLHHFEHLKFEDAVEHVGREVGAQPYLSHEEYLKAWQSGRITDDEVRTAVRFSPKNNEKSTVSPFISAEDLEFLAVQIPVKTHNLASLEWLILESKGSLFKGVGSNQHKNDSNQGMNWHAALPKVQAKISILFAKNPSWIASASTDRMATFSPTRVELDRINHAAISLIAAYLDQGISHWSMPQHSEGGLWSSAHHLFAPGSKYSLSELSWPVAMKDIWQKTANLDSVEVICLLLQSLGIPEAFWNDFILRDNLEVSGWAGLVGMLEGSTALFPGQPRPVLLADFVALRLAIHLAVRKETLRKDRPIEAASEKTWTLESLDASVRESTLTYQILALSHLAKFSLRFVEDMPQDDFEALAKFLWEFGDVPRRRILHQAYERTFQSRILTALHATNRDQPTRNLESKGHARPTFQAAFCIDEREESFRRHLEELCPEVETFGAAGFFNVPVAFKALGEKNPVPLCPVVINPRNLVYEEKSQESVGFLHQSIKGVTTSIPRFMHLHSRSLILGQVIHLAAGAVGAAELFLRTATPSLARRISYWSSRKNPSENVSLHYSKKTKDDSQISTILGDLTTGFTVEEMAERVSGLLKTIGLTKNFARLVFLIGHGSTTNNNPFASAYECGACGGRRGDRNGRIFALMANRSDVRALVRDRGVDIPSDTVFVGACHDTCSDGIDLFDVENIPASHQKDLSDASRYLDLAREHNAQERCRRFANAKDLGRRESLTHVEARSFNMREPRPEYGHGSNAACIIGRRDFTRGLFLDRRSFLVSYDLRQDTSGKILESILAAVMPVCSGISLEYYFSRIDNRRYGAGTKLPHNVVSMLGVMDGLKSDLRTGLPWQTVEIHEPMRLFTVIEAPLARIRAALAQLPAVANMLEKRWIVLAFADPETGESGWLTKDNVEVFKNKGIELPTFSNSRSYYEGASEHLVPVLIANTRHSGVAS